MEAFQDVLLHYMQEVWDMRVCQTCSMLEAAQGFSLPMVLAGSLALCPWWLDWAPKLMMHPWHFWLCMVMLMYAHQADIKWRQISAELSGSRQWLDNKLGPKDSFIQHKADFCPTLLVKLCTHVCVKMHTSWQCTYHNWLGPFWVHTAA